MLLAIAALLLAVYPKAVMDLERRPLTRYGVASTLGFIAIVAGVLASRQQYLTDVAVEKVHSDTVNGLKSVDEHISLFEQHTPTVPKAAFHFSNEEFAVVPIEKGWLIGVNESITNDGDDALYEANGLAAVGTFEGPLARAQSVSDVIRYIQGRLGVLSRRGLTSKALPIRHGETLINTASLAIYKSEIIDSIYLRKKYILLRHRVYL